MQKINSFVHFSLEGLKKNSTYFGGRNKVGLMSNLIFINHFSVNLGGKRTLSIGPNRYVNKTSRLKLLDLSILLEGRN